MKYLKHILALALLTVGLAVHGQVLITNGLGIGHDSLGTTIDNMLIQDDILYMEATFTDSLFSTGSFAVTGVDFDSVNMQVSNFHRRGQRFVVAYDSVAYPTDTTNILFDFTPSDTTAYSDTTVLFPGADSINYFRLFTYGQTSVVWDQDSANIPLLLLNPITVAYLADMSEPWTGDTIGEFDDMIEGLDALGYFFDSNYVFYMFANTTSADALKNILRDSSAYDANLTGSLGTIFTRLRHFQGDGTTDKITTNFNPASAGVPQDRVTVGIGVANNLTNSDRWLFEASDGGGSIQFKVRHAADFAQFYVNTTSSETESPLLDSRGHWQLRRAVAARMQLYRNGVEIDDGANVSTGVPDDDMELLDRTTYQVVYLWMIKGGITAAQAADVNTPIETFLDYLGGGIE